MKETKVKRLLYQDSEAFKAGIEVGRKEVIEKACNYLTKISGLPLHYEEYQRYHDNFITNFRKAMLEGE